MRIKELHISIQLILSSLKIVNNEYMYISTVTSKAVTALAADSKYEK